MKKYRHCVKFTYPLSFQTRIPKVDQHTGGKWLIHIGGQTDKGISLYICRSSIRGAYFSGYYDPSIKQASINSGVFEHPSQIELLSFAPDRPTSTGLIGTVPCPRPNVRSIYAGLEWVEYWAADPVEPAAAVISGNVPQPVAVASTFTTTDIVAKCLYEYSKFCTTYRGIIVCNQWGKVLVPSVSYKFHCWFQRSKQRNNRCPNDRKWPTLYHKEWHYGIQYRYIWPKYRASNPWESWGPASIGQPLGMYGHGHTDNSKMQWLEHLDRQRIQRPQWTNHRYAYPAQRHNYWHPVQIWSTMVIGFLVRCFAWCVH